MKVIKQPDVSKWHKRVKCTNCRARLEVDAGDLVVLADAHRALFTCGHCGDADQCVTRDEMPAHIWAALEAAADDEAEIAKALGRVEPLRVPVKAPERMWFRWRSNGSRSAMTDFSLAPGEVYEAWEAGRVFGAGNWSLPMQRGDRAELRNGAIVINGRGKADGLLAEQTATPEVDADRAAIPPPPKTFDEAVALMRDGWWLEHRSLDVRRIHDGREQIRYRGDRAWKDSSHTTGMCTSGDPAKFTRTYVPIRPES